jgi:hypothetical protein
VDPTYAALIRRFGESTGTPVLLNTSFNLRGEPIVNTPAEAYCTFVRCGYGHRYWRLNSPASQLMWLYWLKTDLWFGFTLRHDCVCLFA